MMFSMRSTAGEIFYEEERCVPLVGSCTVFSGMSEFASLADAKTVLARCSGGEGFSELMVSCSRWRDI